MPPEAPVTVRLKVPAAAVDETASVNVEEALPPAAGVTLVGENVAVTPLGRVLETLSPVAALKPFRLVTVTVAEAELPCPTLSELGEIAIEKSGATMVRVRVDE